MSGVLGKLRALIAEALEDLSDRVRPDGSESVRETLEELIDERPDSLAPIDDNERMLLGNILQLRDLTAADVMVPRADIVSVDVRITLDELVDVFTESGHSRLPVHRKTLDDVIGMVHHKDVLEFSRPSRPVDAQPFNLARLVRRVLFVSPSQRVLDLLLEMRLKRIHMALVVDEFGGVDGLATIEDVVERIVGRIEDEHDTGADPDLVQGADGIIEADGRVLIDHLENMVGPLLEDGDHDEVDTVGGLVFLAAGRVPARGEIIRHAAGLEFEIVDADPRRVKRVRISKCGVAAPPESVDAE